MILKLGSVKGVEVAIVQQNVFNTMIVIKL